MKPVLRFPLEMGIWPFLHPAQGMAPSTLRNLWCWDASPLCSSPGWREGTRWGWWGEKWHLGCSNVGWVKQYPGACPCPQSLHGGLRAACLEELLK